MLDRFLRGEVSDAEFMADDIRLWKSVKPKIHRDDLMRCYQGVKLMTGARELVVWKRKKVNGYSVPFRMAGQVWPNTRSLVFQATSGPCFSGR